MKTLVISNQKGGTGKTAIATHAAYYFAETGLRTLVVDMDAQANATYNLIHDIESTTLLASQLFLNKKLTSIPQKTNYENLSIIAADDGLLEIDEDSKIDENMPTNHLNNLVDDYDLCIIDTPPTLGKRLRSALNASDFIIIPFQPARESLNGIGSLLNTIEHVREISNPKLENLGFLANRVNYKSASDKALLLTMGKSVGKLLLPYTIGERTRIKDSLASMCPVWKNMRGGSDAVAATEMRLVMQYILEQIL